MMSLRSANGLASTLARSRVAARPWPRVVQRCYADESQKKQDQSEVKQQVTGRTPPGPKMGAKPKILDETPPPDPPEEVKQHNREFEQRYDRAGGKINPDGRDNVGKGFWSGEGKAAKEVGKDEK